MDEIKNVKVNEYIRQLLEDKKKASAILKAINSKCKDFFKYYQKTVAKGLASDQDTIARVYELGNSILVIARVKGETDLYITGREKYSHEV